MYLSDKLYQFKNYTHKISVLILIALITACSEDEPSLSESFFKIYDDSNFDVSYRPIDIVEMNDGYIILTGTERSNTDFMGVRLIKIDDEGNYQYDRELNDYVVPIGNMYFNEADSNSYFFAMNPTSLEAVLIAINPQLELQSETLLGGVNYPLSSNSTSTGELLLQSYDPIDQETEITIVTLDGGFGGSARYSIGPGDDVEEEIINHYLNASERPLPFFCGEASASTYYFNGFYNYSFSLVFTNLTDDQPGVVQGQSSNAGIRATLPLGGSEFAVSGFQFDDNYQLASATLSTTGTTSSADLYPGNLAELKPYTPASIIRYSNGSEYSIFASETKSRQVLLNYYAADGTISGTQKIGSLNPFTFSSIKVGADNSLLVLGTTFTAGRFERIFVNKISENEVLGNLN